MIVDNNLICYEYYKTQYTLNPVQISGAKDSDVADDKYAFNPSKLAVLVLEDDIINSEGYGLKKGFYNVKTDKYMDFLLIMQSGQIKAKVPVLKVEVIETINPVQFKPQKMSWKKYQKQQEKEYRKYLDGENPNNVDFKTAQLLRLDDDNSFLLIYNTGSVEVSGIIKF